eukprot:2529-Rhodomonas_salina.1
MGPPGAPTVSPLRAELKQFLAQQPRYFQDMKCHLHDHGRDDFAYVPLSALTEEVGVEAKTDCAVWAGLMAAS